MMLEARPIYIHAGSSQVIVDFGQSTVLKLFGSCRNVYKTDECHMLQKPKFSTEVQYRYHDPSLIPRLTIPRLMFPCSSATLV